MAGLSARIPHLIRSARATPPSIDSHRPCIRREQLLRCVSEDFHEPTRGLNTFLIKVSRTIIGHTLPARLGLWGPTADTVTTVPGNAPHQDQRLHSLTWEIETAPALVTISGLICEIHDRMPRYRLLQSSCYAFARAVGRLIHLRLDGTAGDPQYTPFLIRESYLLHCIPAGITRAERVAVEVSRSCDNLRGGNVIFTFI